MNWFKRNWKWLFGFIAPLGIILWALLQSLFANAINGVIYDKLVYFFGGPPYFWESGRPSSTEHDFFKLMFVLLSIFLTALWVIALALIPFSIYLWKKRGQVVQLSSTVQQEDPSHIAQAELAAAISKIEKNSKNIIQQDELDAVHAWMKAFETGIAAIFSLQRTEYRSYWLVQTTGGYDFVSEDRDLNQNDKHIINNAIKHPSRKNFHDEVRGKYDNYDVYSYFFARNGDRFKLAFVIFIHVDNVVTEQRKQAFELATSSFYLLGSVDKLRKIVLELKHNQ